MNKIKCLIVDDEELARKLVENYVNKIPYLEVVGKCVDPLEAMQVLQEQPVDLMFLDIQMPELTGIEFLKTLSQKPYIIFTTAYKEYALQGYELDVVDYLVKPFRFERFLQAINKVSKLLKQPQTEKGSAQSFDLAEAPEKKFDFILVKSNFKIFRLSYKDIIYIESMKEYVAYHTAEGRILSLGSLKKLQEDLPSDQFIRIHKSFMVNNDYVSALEGNMVHVNKKKITIGSSYRTEVLKRLFE